jgi:hypothetical protein
MPHAKFMLICVQRPKHGTAHSHSLIPTPPPPTWTCRFGGLNLHIQGHERMEKLYPSNPVPVFSPLDYANQPQAEKDAKKKACGIHPSSPPSTKLLLRLFVLVNAERRRLLPIVGCNLGHLRGCRCTTLSARLFAWGRFVLPTRFSFLRI